MAPKAIIFGLACGGAVIVLALALLAASLRKLNSNELGIKYDNIAKVLGDKVNGEGLHGGAPGFSFIIFPSVYQTMEFKDITVGFYTKLGLLRYRLFYFWFSNFYSA